MLEYSSEEETSNAKDAENAEETMKREALNALSGDVVDAAIRVHSTLGPGLLESAYKACLAHELRTRGRFVQTEVLLPVYYDNIRVDAAYRMDLLVEHELVVELKSIARLGDVHAAQLLSHLRLSQRRLGLLINFNVVHLRDGIKRIVNNLD